MRPKLLPPPPNDGAPFNCYKYIVDGKIVVHGVSIDNLVHCKQSIVGLIPPEVKRHSGVTCQVHWDEILDDYPDDED